MLSHKMILNSDDSELLIAFEQGKTVEKTAQIIGKDPSGVSRQLARIASLCPALEKKAGKWTLTETGRLLCSATKDFIQAQRTISFQKTVLKIGSNREFCSRIIGPQLEQLQKTLPGVFLSIYAFESGTEEALLSGKIDIGIDCDKPFSPEIKFKLLVKEDIYAVCSPNFKKKYLKQIKNMDLKELPHLLCDRLHPHRITNELNNINAAANFNDIATAREASKNSSGWALLPKYCVANELKEKSLIRIGKKSWGQSKYGIWWSRERFKDKDIINKLSHWLEMQSL